MLFLGLIFTCSCFWRKVKLTFLTDLLVISQKYYKAVYQRGHLVGCYMYLCSSVAVLFIYHIFLKQLVVFLLRVNVHKYFTFFFEVPFSQQVCCWKLIPLAVYLFFLWLHKVKVGEYLQYLNKANVLQFCDILFITLYLHKNVHHVWYAICLLFLEHPQ